MTDTEALAAVISRRDADDRADRLETQEEALSVLTRAISTDDTELAHAVLRRAADAQWRPVVTAFAMLTAPAEPVEYPDSWKAKVG